MKKFLFLCTAIAVSTTVFSQARFGVKGGLNLANQKIKASVMGMGGSKLADGIVSFHIGGVAEIPISTKFSFRPELLLSGKGSNLDGDVNGDPGTAKFRPFYIEVPLNFVYTHELPEGIRLFAGAGPSIGVGAFGKVKYENLSDDAFQDSGFKRMDFGINFLAGIELNSGVTFGVNFTPGLANIYNLDVEDIDINFTNKVFAFSVGYMFNRRRK